MIQFINFDHVGYQKKRSKQKRRIWIFGGLATFFLVGGLRSASITSLIFGGLFAYFSWSNYQAYSLPLHDAIHFIRALQAPFSRAELFSALELSLKQVDELLNELIRLGFIEPHESDISETGEVLYRLVSHRSS